jgi:hypothetical protein
MNYKDKYFKYKNKYLLLKNQLGGGLLVPNNLPSTQSWFIMPVLLMPFFDIQVDFPEQFYQNDITGKEFGFDNSFNIREIVDKLKEYYTKFGVDFNNRRTLEKIPNIIFDDKPKYLHLSAESQEMIIDAIDVRVSFDIIIYNIVSKYSKWGYNYYRKDVIWENFDGVIIPIQYINNYNKHLLLNDRNSNYQLYDDVTCLVIEKTNNSNNNVLICFGYWADDNFGMIHSVSRFYDGKIIYMVDKDKKWYSNKFIYYIKLINKYANESINYYFLGMSMGGYASIYMSLSFPGKNCVCISFVPQILSTGKKDNIIIVQKSDNKKIDPLMKIEYNVLDKLKENLHYTTKMFILTGKSECEDKNEWILMDNFHIGLIADYPNVNIIITDFETHGIGFKMKLSNIIRFINDNRTFDIMFNNQKEGNKYLSEKIELR